MISDLRSEVQNVFAEITRYPVEILTPEADLEQDLGIDSVKLGEVFSVLRGRFELPDSVDIPRQNLTTISAVTEALAQFVNGHRAIPATKSVAASVSTVNGNGAAKLNGAAVAPPAAAQSDILSQVKSIFAEVTRYPFEILDADAGLEEDLGIDSVKLGEIFSVLREKFALPADLSIARDEVRTIGAVAEALSSYIKPKSPATNGRTSHVETERRIAAATIDMDAVPPVNGRGTSPDLVEEVRDVFAEITRYPRELLLPEASLEDDLGIDSVKLGELISVFRQKYQLPERLEAPREQLRSIHDIAGVLQPYARGRANAAAAGAGGKVNGHAATITTPTSVRVNDTAVRNAALYDSKLPSSKPFTGKVAFVSGSGRGLGKDIATYLASLGASVVINSFHSRTKGDETAREIQDSGGEALHLWGSMANPEHVHKVFDEIEARHGYLDFFIGNASNGMLARLEDITVEHWEKAYRTNVIGLHQSALRAVKLMRRRGGGKIITLSSPAAHGYVDYFGCMGTVKAAVESLTRSMAIEFAPYNIQVNCVSPGPVYGELLDKWPESERLVRQWESNTAYPRLCEARDVSHFIAYLLSEPVKLFNGSVLVMDGGISSQGW